MRIEIKLAWDSEIFWRRWRKVFAFFKRKRGINLDPDPALKIREAIAPSICPGEHYKTK